MTKSRLALGAFLLTAATIAWAQAPGQSKRVSAEACKGQVCRLTVRVEGDCGISVEPEWLFVTGPNVRIVWDILPAGFAFHPVQGVRFKDDYNPAWRSQFYQGGEGIFSTDVVQVGPFKPQGASRQAVWNDLNSDRGVFRYSVTVVNTRTNQECSADPGVVNDWE